MNINRVNKIAKTNKTNYDNIMTFLRNNYYYDRDNWLTVQIVSDKLDVMESQIVEILEELKTIDGTIKIKNDNFKLTYKGVIHLNEIQKHYQNYMISTFSLIISFIGIILNLGFELTDAINSKEYFNLIPKGIISIAVVINLLNAMKIFKN